MSKQSLRHPKKDGDLVVDYIPQGTKPIEDVSTGFTKSCECSTMRWMSNNLVIGYLLAVHDHFRRRGNRECSGGVYSEGNPEKCPNLLCSCKMDPKQLQLKEAVADLHDVHFRKPVHLRGREVTIWDAFAAIDDIMRDEFGTVTDLLSMATKLPSRAKQIRYTKMVFLSLFVALTTAFTVLSIPGVNDKYGLKAAVRYQVGPDVEWSTSWYAGSYSMTIVPGVGMLCWLLRCVVYPGWYNMSICDGTMADTLIALGISDAFVFLGLSGVAGIRDLNALVFGAVVLFAAQSLLVGYIRSPWKYKLNAVVSLLAMISPFVLLVVSYIYYEQSTNKTILIAATLGLMVLRQLAVLWLPMYSKIDKLLLHLRLDWFAWGLNLTCSIVFCLLGYMHGFSNDEDIIFT